MQNSFKIILLTLFFLPLPLLAVSEGCYDKKEVSKQYKIEDYFSQCSSQNRQKDLSVSPEEQYKEGYQPNCFLYYPIRAQSTDEKSCSWHLIKEWEWYSLSEVSRPYYPYSLESISEQCGCPIFDYQTLKTMTIDGKCARFNQLVLKIFTGQINCNSDKEGYDNFCMRTLEHIEELYSYCSRSEIQSLSNERDDKTSDGWEEMFGSPAWLIQK